MTNKMMGMRGMMGCKHRDSLGRPGEGVHTHVFGIAWVDVLCTAAVAWLFAWWTGYPLWAVAAALFGAGIVAHRAFCVRTAVDRFLFGPSK